MQVPEILRVLFLRIRFHHVPFALVRPGAEYLNLLNGYEACRDTQYRHLCHQAQLYGTNPTRLCKDIILESIGKGAVIPRKEALLRILRHIHAASVIAHHGDAPSEAVQQHLAEAQEALLRYLDITI